MRKVFAVLAISILTGSPAVASSFVTLGAADATEAAPAIASASSSFLDLSQPAPSSGSMPADQAASPSISHYGEPAPVTATVKAVDNTATASVSDGNSQTTERSRIKTAWAQAEADAAWAKTAATASPSLIFYGTPAKVIVKDAEPLPQPTTVAVFDPNKIPLVMRGGIAGDALPVPTAGADTAVTTTVDESAASFDAQAEEERLARRAKEREATPSAPLPVRTLSERGQAKILPQ